MRSTFRDWAGNATKFPRELAEFALAHAIKGSAEAAYWCGGRDYKREAPSPIMPAPVIKRTRSCSRMSIIR
jgi:hypothetical protein